MDMDPLYPPEEIPTALCLALFCLRKSVAWPHRYLELMVKHSKKLQPLICPLHTPVYPVVEWSLKGTSQVFCPWRGIIPSFKCSPRRVTFSPSSTKGIPTLHCLISTPGLPLFSPQENHNQPGYTPANGADF